MTPKGAMRNGGNMSENQNNSIQVQYRLHSYDILIHEKMTVAELQEQICRATGVLPKHQKLLTPPKARRLGQILRSGNTNQQLLPDVGLSAGMRLTLVGAPVHEVEREQMQEASLDKSNGPRRLHPSLLKNMQPTKSLPDAQVTATFGRCRPHSSTQDADPWHKNVRQYLERLASDPAVLHVCKLHHYKVGELCELLPHENPELLGLNVNKGQRILLRVRTDAADGLRDYKTTRRVLLHELCHNEVRIQQTLTAI